VGHPAKKATTSSSRIGGVQNLSALKEIP
jgi:hypothetical protein